MGCWNEDCAGRAEMVDEEEGGVDVRTTTTPLEKGFWNGDEDEFNEIVVDQFQRDTKEK